MEAAKLVRKFLDLSTGHLSQGALNALEASSEDQGGGSLSCSKTPHGFWVWISEDEVEAAASGVPHDILAIFHVARINGCDYVQFDADASECDDLPILHPDSVKDMPAAYLAEQYATRARLHAELAARIERGCADRDHFGPDPDGLDRDNLGETPEPGDGGDADRC